MKDTEREKTTAELIEWQLRKKEEAQLQLKSQTEKQNELKAMTEKQENGYLGGGKVKLSK